MIKINPIFWENGAMSPLLKLRKHFLLKGILDKNLEGYTAVMLPMKESDIMDIREMLLKEVKRQNNKYK